MIGNARDPRVVVEMSMSLDGFVARRCDHSTDEVHAWYPAGEVEVRMPNHELTFHVDEASEPSSDQPWNSEQT